MILKVCGEGPIVPGFPNADIAIATGGNSNEGSFKDWDDRIANLMVGNHGYNSGNNTFDWSWWVIIADEFSTDVGGMLIREAQLTNRFHMGQQVRIILADLRDEVPCMTCGDAD